MMNCWPGITPPSTQTSPTQQNWFGYVPADDDFEDVTKVEKKKATFVVEEEVEITFIHVRHRYVVKCGGWSLTGAWSDSPSLKKEKIEFVLNAIDKHSFSIATQGLDTVDLRKIWTQKLIEHEEAAKIQ